MNAIIISALWGVVMMFGGVFFKKPTTPKYWAIAGIIILLAGKCLEFFGTRFLMWIPKECCGLIILASNFNTISFACTLLYFLLNGREIEKVGRMYPNILR